MRKLEIILKDCNDPFNWKRTNLHVHSNKSDGRFSPKGVVKYLHNQWDIIALTDHDTVSGVEEAISAGNKLGIEVIPGVEITTLHNNKRVHLLAYDIDSHNNTLNRTLQKIRNWRKLRVKQMLNQLNAAGFNLDYKEVTKFNCESIGKRHVAEVMVMHGYKFSIKEASREYLSEGKVGYVKYTTITTKEAINVVKKAGGISIIAHPGERQITEDDILSMVKEGLKGIEVYTPKHSAKDTDYYHDIAKRHNLLITGGTDFHDIHYDS